jgi:hypothetical protein
VTTVRAVLLGVIGLAIFDGIVSHQGDVKAVGGAWKFANDALQRFLSPAVAVFGSGSTPAPAPATTTAATTSTAAPVTVAATSGSNLFS